MNPISHISLFSLCHRCRRRGKVPLCRHSSRGATESFWHFFKAANSFTRFWQNACAKSFCFSPLCLCRGRHESPQVLLDQISGIIEFGSLGGIRISKLADAVMRASWNAGTLVLTASGPAVLIENWILLSPGINIAVIDRLELNAISFRVVLMEGEKSLESTAIMSGLWQMPNWWVWWKVNKVCCTIRRGGFEVCYRVHWREI